MDFDHINPTEKLFTIGKVMSSNYSEQELLAEMAKCEIVCALCHRYRTFGNGARRYGLPDLSDKQFD